MALLEGAIQRPVEVAVMHQLLERVPLDGFCGTEAQRLAVLKEKPSFLPERELVRIVHSDCCVEVEANWHSAPQQLLRQQVSALVRGDHQIKTWT